MGRFKNKHATPGLVSTAKKRKKEKKNFLQK